MTFSESHCEVCRVGAPSLTEVEVKEALSVLDGWQVVAVGGADVFEKTFGFTNFKDAMAFANGVAEIAEIENHHPELVVAWGAVTVRWWTHKIGGLHRNDAIMAAKTDQLI